MPGKFKDVLSKLASVKKLMAAAEGCVVRTAEATLPFLQERSRFGHLEFSAERALKRGRVQQMPDVATLRAKLTLLRPVPDDPEPVRAVRTAAAKKVPSPAGLVALSSIASQDSLARLNWNRLKGWSWARDVEEEALGPPKGPRPSRVEPLQDRPRPQPDHEILRQTRKMVDDLDWRSYSATTDPLGLARLYRLCRHLRKHPWTAGQALRAGAVYRVEALRHRVPKHSVSWPQADLQARETLELLGQHQAPPGRGVRILTIDGGGMRGFVALEILKCIEQVSGRRIHQLFDLICGVSTGAIIASFLGFHNKSIVEIEDAYSTIGVRVFRQGFFGGARGWVLNHSYYDSRMFEEVLKESVGTTATIETMRSVSTPKVAIVSTLVGEDRVSPFVFRNYVLPPRTQSSFRGSSEEPIWAAVRASTAAPGYFDDFIWKGAVHQDGGILTNNASHIAIHEAMKIWPGVPLQCVVSLGLGRTDKFLETLRNGIGGMAKPAEAKPVEAKALSLAQKFARIVDSATDTELVHETLHDLLPGHVYFRFNPYLNEYLGLDETRPEKFLQMRESAKMYLRRNERKIQDACHQLMRAKPFSNRIAEYLDRRYKILQSHMNSPSLPDDDRGFE